MRTRGIDLVARAVRITNLTGSDQEKDLSEPTNCGGFGRVRHFRRATSAGWPANPLPVMPAARSLGIDVPEILEAQVFQNAVCNWRCWYCFVDFPLLSGREDLSSMLKAEELVALYAAEERRPAVIDLSGGQPDLVPEWVPWMMNALTEAELTESVYLWSDDNLSNDYFWRFLSREDRERVSGYKRYGKVCCFKGYDAESFAFNTSAQPELFDRQFQLMRRLIEGTDIDLYAYVTLTSPSDHGIERSVADFVDRLQELDAALPLRTVPLEISPFTPVRARGVTSEHEHAMHVQQRAVAAWNEEIDARFTAAARAVPICDVRLRSE
jgi:uncharacterized Fe-S cluster-containing radical SAM superfamily protein